MPIQLLHLDSSILGNGSVSRTLSASVVARLSKDLPDPKVTYRYLAADPLPHLTAPALMAARAGTVPDDPAVRADLAVNQAVLEQFLAADIVVIGMGLYNFGVPSQLKAWVDRIVMAGKTFRYTEKGPVGLLSPDKRVILAVARGSQYAPGSPAAAFEHAGTYMKHVFGFLGVHKLEVISADGVATGPEARQASLDKAKDAIAALVA